MTIGAFLAMALALVISPFCTLLSIRAIRSRERPVWKATLRWIKDVIDSLFGAG